MLGCYCGSSVCAVLSGEIILLQKEFTVYVDKNGLVQDLLAEAAKEVCCSLNYSE